jgi:Family of unknown function (DUF5681)
MAGPGRPFAPGVSGNPGGRPKGLVRRIHEETGDGAELVDYMLSVFRDGHESTKSRVQAATWLADRGFGKPTQTQAVELSADGGLDLEGAKARLTHKLGLTLADLARYAVELGYEPRSAELDADVVARAKGGERRDADDLVLTEAYARCPEGRVEAELPVLIIEGEGP